MADTRHKRDTNARRFIPFRVRAVVIAGPLAVLATGSAVTVGVVGSTPQASDFLSAQTAGASIGAPTGASPLPPAARGKTVSRSAPRQETQPSKLDQITAPAAVKKAIKRADQKLWTQAPLNLWTEPGEQAKKLGELEPATKVLVTGRTLFGRDEVVVDGKARWVSARLPFQGEAVRPRW